MSSHFDDTIEHYQRKIAALEKQLADTKRMVNSLSTDAGRPAIYASVEPDESPALASIKGDTFYGVPLATAATSYLKMRRASNMGPAKMNEIFEALKSGGFHFGAVNEDYAKRGLRNSLSKNTATFHKLPNGEYGLLEWYPLAKRAKPKAVEPDEDKDDSDDDDEADDAEDEDVEDGEADAEEPVEKAKQTNSTGPDGTPSRLKVVRRRNSITK